MPTRLTVPTLQQHTCIIKLPVLRESAAEAIKKEKVSTKRWKDFNRQAARRKKPVGLSFREYMRLITRPCVYCGAGERGGVDRVNNNESYTRQNSVPCCGPGNLSKRNFGLRDFVQRARAVAKQRDQLPLCLRGAARFDGPRKGNYLLIKSLLKQA